MAFRGAGVQVPIIGVDMLALYGLLVNCSHNLKLNGVTSLSTTGLIAPPYVPSEKLAQEARPPTAS